MTTLPTESLSFRPGNLVLYKNRPARVCVAGEKMELELENGEHVRVRPKDARLLHRGPLNRMDELKPLAGDAHAAWEIVDGQTVTLEDLAGLIFGDFTPSSAWAAWQLVMEGFYFRGAPDALTGCLPEEVAQKQASRNALAERERAWAGFVERLKANALQPEDCRFLDETEQLSFGRGTHSKALRALGRPETPEEAYTLLLQSGCWKEPLNPYPRRLGLPTAAPALEMGEWVDPLPRLDLTGLPAWAVDDAGTNNPDDAFSWDNGRLWVHVADPAARIAPDSPMDLEARARAGSLHIPEGTIHNVPEAIIQQFGLGLNEVSPALSFGFDLDLESGEVLGLTIQPSQVRVLRLTYEEADLCMEQEPFRTLEPLLAARRARRAAAGAIMIELPEVKLKVKAGVLDIHPVLPLRSRCLVEEMMILTGEQTALWAVEHGVRLPFSTQDAPDEPIGRPTTLSGMFAVRRQMKRSRYRTTPGGHAGLGLRQYAQATSPLRRYLDLVTHQQIRATLAGQPALSESQLLERIGAVEATWGLLRQAETYSNRHWLLRYLQENPDWEGDGVLVDRRNGSGVVLIPALALEVRMAAPPEIALDQPLRLKAQRVNLAELDVQFALSTQS